MYLLKKGKRIFLYYKLFESRDVGICSCWDLNEILFVFSGKYTHSDFIVIADSVRDQERNFASRSFITEDLPWITSLYTPQEEKTFLVYSTKHNNDAD